ncbi:MAG TPA: dipeptidase [Gemmatimonadaceae bacterium]
MRVSRLLRLAPALVLAACTAKSQPAAEQDVAERARAIQDSVITIDTHDDIPGNFASVEVDPLDAPRQVNITKMKDGGLDVAFFAVFVGQTPRTPENYGKAKAAAMEKFDAIHRMTEKMYPGMIEIAYTPADVRRIHESGKLVAAIGIENGYVIGKDLGLIRKYYDLGARYMTLAHTRNNDICDSSTDPAGPEHHGLSAFGKKVVAEMNRVGMMVDVSHVSKECMMQATELSKAPVIASHSSTGALANVPRNMDDEQLEAVKKNGGVVQIVAFDGYVKAPAPEKLAAIDSLREKLGLTARGAFRNMPADKRAIYDSEMAAIEKKWPKATLQEFVDHIDHAVKLIGIEHVGISSDFDGGGGVTGWNDASETRNVTTELVKRGYTTEQIRMLWGGNVLRVWGECDSLATAARGTKA